MKNVFIKSFFSYAILSLLIVSNIYATNPGLKELLTISNAKIISYDEAAKTAVVQYTVGVVFQENDGGDSKIKLILIGSLD